MNDPDSFHDGNPSDGAPPYEWIDEWLCEYVDGAMDPSVETVFAQYVEANPELKAHVERLRKTRELLCNCSGPPAPASDADQTESSDADDPERSPSESPTRTITIYSAGPVGVVSSVVVALAVGFLAGTLFVGAPAPPPSTSTTAAPSDRSSPPVQDSRASPSPLPYTDRTAARLSPSDSVRLPVALRRSP